MSFIEDQAIVQSRLGADFYKLLMGQLIQARHSRRQVTFALSNRTGAVRLAELIDAGKLREQLQAPRRLHYTPAELGWLGTQKFYGQSELFKPSFLEHDVAAVKLSDNRQKALGPPAMLARFERIFGARGRADTAVVL